MRRSDAPEAAPRAQPRTVSQNHPVASRKRTVKFAVAQHLHSRFPRAFSWHGFAP